MPKKLVFVSCGQETEQERNLGRRLCQTVDAFARTKAFYADLVHSAADLNSELFSALNRCDAFLAVMHDRGTVTYAGHPTTQRASVWVHQEIAILCYRMFLQKRTIPIRVYMEQSILLEGVMKTAIVNPIRFKDDTEVLDSLSTWLSGHEFAEDPVTARRENIFRRRIRSLGEVEWLVLELTAAHTPAPGERVRHHSVFQDFSYHYRVVGQADPQIRESFNSAVSKLNAEYLVFHEVEGAMHHLTIAQQWWDLLLDELRSQGRNV